MIPQVKRGWGAAGPPKPTTVVERYGISPQIAPARMTPMDKKCLNSPVVATPNKPGAKM